MDYQGLRNEKINRRGQAVTQQTNTMGKHMGPEDSFIGLTIVFDTVFVDQTDVRQKYTPVLVFMLGNVLKHTHTHKQTIVISYPKVNKMPDV